VLKAYDTILRSEVSAELIALSGGSNEPYRFECSHCGEEICLAASNSNRMIPHFRHRWGNNDTDCENYLGNNRTINIDSRSRISTRERLEFYYDNQLKTFSIGLHYSESEIQSYEENNVSVELKTQHSGTPFKTLAINTTNFAPDAPTYIHLSQFSQNYYLSNTLNSNSSRDYHFMKPGANPVFFKMQGNDVNSKAKLVRTPVLFTNTQYFIIFQSQYSVYRFHVDMQIGEQVSFETMGRRFAGFPLLIKKKSDQINSLLKSWGYELEANETLTLLWPPAATANEACLIESDNIFVYTSFQLQAYGNINVHSSDIRNCGNGVSSIAISSRTKIYRKNAEMTFEKRDSKPDDFDLISVLEDFASLYTVPNDGNFYLFSRFGVVSLSRGQVMILTPNSEIRRYDTGYLIHRIFQSPMIRLTGESLLADILMHYKRSEPYDHTPFELLNLSDVAGQYIAECKATSYINSAASRYILEGML
jgi:hypothetical protein